MNKNLNMVIFFAIATVFNIVMMLVVLLVIGVLVGWILGDKMTGVLGQILLFVDFLASIVLTFLTYGWLLKKVQKKIDLEKLVPQLFKPRKN